MRRNRLPFLIMAMAMAAILLSTGTAGASRPVTVRVRLPVEAKLDSAGIRRILVGGFITNDSPFMDTEKEMVDLLRQLAD